MDNHVLLRLRCVVKCSYSRFLMSGSAEVLAEDAIEQLLNHVLGNSNPFACELYRASHWV